MFSSSNVAVFEMKDDDDLIIFNKDYNVFAGMDNVEELCQTHFGNNTSVLQGSRTFRPVTFRPATFRPVA